MRNAFVAQYAETRPQRALAAWHSNPRAELWASLTQIAAATRAQQQVRPDVLEDVRDAARKAPLAAEPFLVRGVQARVAGDESLAARAFLAAELRDGRSVPARYFLADHYLRTGDAPRGLREVAVLARMIPDGIAALSPYVATYARESRNLPELHALFRSDPQIEDATLGVLATDPANSDLILQLATPRRTGQARPWADRLLLALVKSGDYAKAADVWTSVAQVKRAPGALIYDTAFKDAAAPAPFNWTLTASAAGLAERQGGGRLHVLYYAQEDGVLATQLLRLAPGKYRIAMQVSGQAGGTLGWTVTCANAQTPLLGVRLAPRINSSFEVPAGCTAQWLQLAGTAPELPQSVDVTISGLRLTREQPGG
ncbi:hypothetical protein [Sphingomonas sp. F9_3S_D5_B_2]